MCVYVCFLQPSHLCVNIDNLTIFYRSTCTIIERKRRDDSSPSLVCICTLSLSVCLSVFLIFLFFHVYPGLLFCYSCIFLSVPVFLLLDLPLYFSSTLSLNPIPSYFTFLLPTLSLSLRPLALHPTSLSYYYPVCPCPSFPLP